MRCVATKLRYTTRLFRDSQSSSNLHPIIIFIKKTPKLLTLLSIILQSEIVSQIFKRRRVVSYYQEKYARFSFNNPNFKHVLFFGLIVGFFFFLIVVLQYFRNKIKKVLKFNYSFSSVLEKSVLFCALKRKF